MAQTHDPSQPPPDHWDEELAATLAGKTILVGLTYLSRDEAIVGREQLYGIVVAADRRQGIVLELDGQRVGERYVLPPTTAALERARLGEYRLSATGETVSDPDYLATFSIYARADG